MSIIIVGEFWNAEEEKQRMPFLGPPGYCLNKMLEEAGIERHRCYLTNVFNLRPRPTIDITNLCGKKAEVTNKLPPVRNGKYIRDEYLPELDRLFHELESGHPNLIIAMGSVASWALLSDSRISKIRGAIAESRFGKVLPTYHPSDILRQWDMRHVTVLDLMKARRESMFPEIRRPSREIWLEPTIGDIEFFFNICRSAEHVAVDIETIGSQITCIGFAPRSDLALVIPFWNPSGGGNYWKESKDECQAWRAIRTFLRSDVPKTFQNGLYDVRFLWETYGMPVFNWRDDTMLLHHALYPESEKGLGFLGSVYTNEPSWKLMRGKGIGTIKQEN